MQIVEYTEAVDLTMHGMHDDIYLVQPVAIKNMTLQEVREAAKAGALFAVMSEPQEEKGSEEPDPDAEELTPEQNEAEPVQKEPESVQESQEQKKAEKKAPKGQTAVLDQLAGYGSRKKLDAGKMKALRDAGWSYKKIADEMGCSEGTVWNFFNKQMGRTENGSKN